MTNIIEDSTSGVHISPAVPNTELYEKYENIITSWGHEGLISKIGLVSSTGSDIPMLGFYEGDIFTVCPAELKDIYAQRVKTVTSAFELSTIVDRTVMGIERYLLADQYV